MTEQDQIRNTLKKMSLFHHCDDAVLESFVKQSHVMSFPKGKVIFVHEELAQRFYIVLSGSVKLFRETMGGTQAIVDILLRGHMFGETSMFLNDTYAYSAEVIESAQIISLPLPILKSAIDSNPKIAVSMLAIMSHHRQQQDKELEHMTIQNAPQRIGCFILSLVAQKNKTGMITIDLPYDKTLVAARLGMQPETFSRALSTLKDKTGMRVKGASIELDDVQQLAGYVCTSCSASFPCKDFGEKF